MRSTSFLFCSSGYSARSRQPGSIFIATRVEERDGKGLGDSSDAGFKQIFRIDLDGAKDVSGIAGEANLAPLAMSKTLFVDLVAGLTAHGISTKDLPAKLEGITFGPDVRIDGVLKHTLFVSTDNDFLPTITDSNHPNGIANPNQVFVFSIDPSVLPTREEQGISVDSEDAQDDSAN